MKLGSLFYSNLSALKTASKLSTNNQLCFQFDDGSMKLRVKGKKQINRKLTPLNRKGYVSLFYENLREVSVNFKIKGGVSVIYIDFRGGECNYP
jgi:hypothetical protein